MAFNIKLDSPVVDFKIGDKTFEADISDENVKKFVDKVTELKEIEEKDFEVEDDLRELIVTKSGEALGVIFEENPCNYILSATGRYMRLFDVLIEIKTEIEKESIDSIENKVNKYMNKPKNKKKK